MNRFRSNMSLAGLAFVVACALALLSVCIQRAGPNVVQNGNLCGVVHSDPCYEHALEGGFPIAYLIDMPGVSVEGKLGFEDTLRPGALVLDTVIYFGAILFSMWVALRKRLRGARGTDS